MSKDKFTYSTDRERLTEIKIFAAKANISANRVIDMAIDKYLSEQDKVFKMTDSDTLQGKLP